ncbi:MAG: ATP-grasp domain-containing protein [Balneolaceae bacterium]
MPETPIHALSRSGAQPKIARFSRYVHSHECLRATTKEGIFQELLNRIKDKKAPVLLPVDEDFVRILSSLKERLEEHTFLPPMPCPDLLDSLVYKNKLDELLDSNHFPCAVTYPLSRIEQSGLNDSFYPCLLKPVRGCSGQGIVKVTERKLLAAHIRNINVDDYILQEFIPGLNIDCSLLAVDGEIKAFTIQKGLANTGFVFPTEIRFEFNKAVFSSVQRLIRITGYSGLAHLDFRLDERDGKPKLIDFNARFWHSLLGSKMAGVDFALLYCFAAMGIPFDRPRFNENTYLMGRSSIRHHVLNAFRTSGPEKRLIATDFWDRLKDPLPEIMKGLE